MKRTGFIILIVLIVSLFSGTGYYFYEKSDDPKTEYKTDTAYVMDIIKKTVAAGSIVPRKEIEIKSQVSGVVDELYTDAGTQINVGDLIARIKIIPDVVALNNAQASVENARINFENAQKELQRQKQLFDEKVISEFEYNQFLLDYNLKEQQLEAAQNNLELIREGASKKSGSVSNLVKSTVNGMVLDVPVKEGSFIVETNTFNEGTTIASIADMQQMIFEGQVNESEVGLLKEGMPLLLNVGALESDPFTAELEYISPKGIEEEGAIEFEIRAAVDLQEDKFLRAGYSANADIILARRDSVVAVKESDVISEKGETFLEVEVAPQKFERQKIITGLSDGINIEVVEGIKKGDRIKKQ